MKRFCGSNQSLRFQACFADETKKVARFLAVLIFISYLCA
jgi:hypothetical protein